MRGRNSNSGLLRKLKETCFGIALGGTLLFSSGCILAKRVVTYHAVCDVTTIPPGAHVIEQGKERLPERPPSASGEPLDATEMIFAGSRSLSEYDIDVTDRVMKEGMKFEVPFPPLLLKKEGYKPVVLNFGSWEVDFGDEKKSFVGIDRFPGLRRNHYLYRKEVRFGNSAKPIILQRDPNYTGPTGDLANKVRVTMNYPPLTPFAPQQAAGYQ